MTAPAAPDDEPERPELAMQTRCVHCLREQYMLNVVPVSTGEAGCTWCGRRSQPMTYPEYRDALDVARHQADKAAGR